jgi:ferredoxin-NADP reductase
VPPPAQRPDLPPGVSSNHFHDRVQVGDVLEVKAPSGHFFIDPDPAVPAVLITGLSKSGFASGFGALATPLLALAVPSA